MNEELIDLIVKKIQKGAMRVADIQEGSNFLEREILDCITQCGRQIRRRLDPQEKVTLIKIVSRYNKELFKRQDN